jgi:hypothetical protein
LLPLDPLSSSTLAGDGIDAAEGEAVPAGRGATGCGAGAGARSTSPGVVGVAVPLGTGVGVLAPGAGVGAPPGAPGTVVIGGTSEIVVLSTSGIARATPIAPLAITPMPSAETAVMVTHRRDAAMT